MYRHDISLSIISNRGAQFTSIFWRSFKERLGTKVKLSTAFHPQIDFQAECSVQTLADMLRVVLLISREIGIRIFLWWSLLTAIVFIHPYTWLLMKTGIVGGVGLLLNGLKWVSLHFWVPF